MTKAISLGIIVVGLSLSGVASAASNYNDVVILGSKRPAPIRLAQQYNSPQVQQRQNAQQLQQRQTIQPSYQSGQTTQPYQSGQGAQQYQTEQSCCEMLRQRRNESGVMMERREMRPQQQQPTHRWIDDR